MNTFEQEIDIVFLIFDLVFSMNFCDLKSSIDRAAAQALGDTAREECACELSQGI